MSPGAGRSRVLARAFVSVVMCLLAMGVGSALALRMGTSVAHALVISGVSVALGVSLVMWALRTVDRVLFPARAEYKPTIEQLSAELLSINSPDEVARAMERTVVRWLPCDEIELSLSDPEEDGGEVRSGQFQKRSGKRVRAEIEIPVTFEGRRLATLFAGKKRGEVPFTSDDLDLMRTIANQGALALAHAFAYQALEEQRRLQAAAWIGERDALVETVAAEIAHDIRQPLNFFRVVFDQAGRGHALDPEDVELARDEVDRLERLVAGLKRVATRQMDRKLVKVHALCDRVELLLRDTLPNRVIDRNIDEDAVILCDMDKLTRVLVNLVVNALQAAGSSGRVGIVFRRTQQGQELSVWDDGPGFDEPARLFAPWYTTKPRGTGLGLAIAHRLVRAHGWNIGAARRDGRTVFAITIVSRDAVDTEERDTQDVA